MTNTPSSTADAARLALTPDGGHGVILGVLNDVTITQASAVWELREAAQGMPSWKLYRTAMRIGRDHIASTIYTIVLPTPVLPCRCCC